MSKIKVAVNGNGVIGKRVAHAIALQDDILRNTHAELFIRKTV